MECMLHLGQPSFDASASQNHSIPEYERAWRAGACKLGRVHTTVEGAFTLVQNVREVGKGRFWGCRGVCGSGL